MKFDVVVASKHVMDSLSAKQQNWLKQAMNDAVDMQKSLWMSAENEALAAVKLAGVEVITPDKTPFFTAVSSFHATFDNTIVGDYLLRIKAIKNNTNSDVKKLSQGNNHE